jgi:hypothetical protein
MTTTTADANTPAAPPTRAPEPNNLPLGMWIAAGLRTHGLAAHDEPVPTTSRFPNMTFVSSVPMAQVRSHSPLRGSSGFSPDSLLGPAHVPDTAIDHKILCLGAGVNPVGIGVEAG